MNNISPFNKPSTHRIDCALIDINRATTLAHLVTALYGSLTRDACNSASLITVAHVVAFW